jgi:cytochrome c-type biogenesis protein CcmH
MSWRSAAIAAGALSVAVAAVPTIGYFTQRPASPQRTASPAAPNSEQHAVAPMVERLAERLRANPEDAAGWAMLGRSYQATGRFAEATAAFAEAAKRTAPDDAQLLADYADALAMKQGRSLAGEPEKLVARALAADPDNLKALALAGTIAFERKDYAGALRHWERMARNAPPGSDAARMAEANVAQARSLAGGGAPAAAAPAAALRGVVRLSPQLAGKVAPTDTVFIYARAAEGSRMPLAILRKEARELPVTFALDDSMAMNPQARLSSVQRVIVAARVSKSGQAAPRPGDLEGQSNSVAPTAQRVDVVIDRETH